MTRANPRTAVSLLLAAFFLGASRPPAAFGQKENVVAPIDPCDGPAAAINPRCGGGFNPRAPSPTPGGGGASDPNPPNPDLGGPHKGKGGGRGPGTATITPQPAPGTPGAPGKPGAPAGQGGDGAAQDGAAAAAPSPFGGKAGDSALAIKAGVELQLGDLAAACDTAGAALKENPNDAKARKIEGLACRGALSSGPKDLGGGDLKPEPQGKDVTLDANSSSKLLRGEAGGGAMTGPGALQAWLVRITETKERGDDAQVILLCDEASREFPGNLNLLNAKATAQNKLKDFKGALATALQALDVDADNAAAHANKAFALGGLGDREGMLAALRAAAALDPRFEAALKAALADDAAGLFAAKAPGLKALPLAVWIGVPAALGFLLMLIVVLLARRSAPPAGEEPEPSGPAAPREIGAGDVLGGNFRVDGELGRGGMGVVFDAFDQKLDRRVAIKQLLRDAATTQADRDRFLREARLVARLKHPNLAEIYTVLDEEGEHLLVFEFVDGRTLDKVIGTNRGIPVAQASKIIAAITGALDYAHGLKIIHRDLKPANVMIARDGTVKIMDFGIAHQASSTGLTRTAASGTPPYMAPEQGMGSVSKSADLYALGVMSYEMLTGVRPFAGPDFLEQKLRREFEPAARRRPELPAGLDAFFASALDPDPTNRPASGFEFASAFQRAVS